MHNHTNKMLIGVMLIMLLSGCSSTGAFISSNLTNVELAKANYKIVATNVTGEAKAAYILGFTYSYGIATTTLAVARVDGTGKLYQEAIAQLWNNYKEAHGEIEGKKLALVNVRYDSDNKNFLVYTEALISVRADIIEFTE